jgi:RND family efflux transporter MFP subunit
MHALRSRRSLLSLPFFALALTSGGCGDAQIAPAKPVPLVRTETVSKVAYAPTTCLTGEVKARVQTNLSFRVSGRIIERNVEVGDHITPDQVLARIDPTEQRADVVSAEAQVRSADARVRQTAAAFERQKSLIKDGFTTQKDYDQAEEALRTAEGSLEVAKAQLSTARDALSYTELRSDTAGIITARNAEAGQVAQAPQTMFTLAEDGARDAVFHVFEAAFLRKMASDTVTLTLVSRHKVIASGVVREVSPTADTSSGTVRVKVSIKNPPPEFTLGSIVSGCATQVPQQVVVLPASVLTSLPGGPGVWVVDGKTKEVSLKAVSVASYETQKVVIDGGLEPGDIVVTAGAKMLRPKQVVALATDNAP